MYRKRILQIYIILKLKSENYFLTDEFNERLVRHRKNIYKRKLTIIAMDDFLNQYDMLSDDLKERAIGVLSILQTTKYIENYGIRLNDREDKIAIKICGLEILLAQHLVIPALVLYNICTDKKNSNIINFVTNTGFGLMTPERIRSKEGMASTIKLKDYGFSTLYEMEQYRQDHKMTDIQEVLESKGWKT